jgi:uncharacterized protein (DUF58 family)
VVREYQDEYFVRHALVLDTFAAAEGPRFEAAVSVAASLACALDTGEALLDLLFVGPRAYVFTAGRGLAHLDQLLEILAVVQPCRDQGFATLARLVMTRAATLSGCLVVLLGWDEERAALVRELDGLGIPTLALVVGESGAPAPAGRVTRVIRIPIDRIAEGLAGLA